MPDEYQRKPRALWLVALIFCVVVIVDSWFRWATFQYRTFDLAFYVQSFWLTLHGKAQASILDVSLMGNHAEPVCYLLLPFFWIWQHPMCFVVIQVVLVATMPFTGYRIARRMEFSRRGATWLGIATLLAPATGFMALHEFHPETLAAPLLLFMLEARQAKRMASFWFWFLLSMACKENVALMLAWFCAVHYLLEREMGREWQTFFNIVPGALAAVWVGIYSVWLGPLLNGGKVDYNELYAHLGGIGGMAKSPGAAIGAVGHAVTGGNLVWGLLVPFLLLPLLRPRWLVIAAPIFAQHLLSFRSSEWTINFHYAAPLLPLLWFATAESCARLYWRDVVAGWVVAACAACQVWIGPANSIARTISTMRVARESARVRAEFIEAIPPGASVVAGLPYLSHLAKRERVHSLHHLLKGLKTLSRAEYTPPAATDAVLIDVADSATFDRAAGYYHPAMQTQDGRVIPESEVLLDQFLAQGTWRNLARNEVTLLLRDNASIAKSANGVGRPLDESHHLLAAQFAPPPAGDNALILLTLEVGKDRKLVPWLTLYLRDAQDRDFPVTKGPIGSGFKPGTAVTESWIIRTPARIPAGKYRAILLFHDNHESLYPGKVRFEKRTFDLGEMEVAN
jgi:uncharacterized membrane protein